MSNWHSISVRISCNDFTSICRICFARNNLKNLQDVEYLIDVLQNLTNTIIDDNDGLPQNICTNCIKKLEDISDFIDLSKYNDSRLREVYLTKSDIETNTITWSNKEEEKSTQNTEIVINNDNNWEKSSNTECNTESDGSLNIKKNVIMKYPDSRRRYPREEYIRRRREQNRKAAQRCRQKRQDRLVILSQTVERMEKINSALKEKKQKLETEFKDLVKVISRFKCVKKHDSVKKEK